MKFNQFKQQVEETRGYCDASDEEKGVLSSPIAYDIFEEVQNSQPGYGQQSSQPGYFGQHSQPGYFGSQQSSQPGYFGHQASQSGYFDQHSQPGYFGQQRSQPGYGQQGSQSGYFGQHSQPGYFGEKKQNAWKNSSTVCQLCGRFGHSAKNCYGR